MAYLNCGSSMSCVYCGAAAYSQMICIGGTNTIIDGKTFCFERNCMEKFQKRHALKEQDKRRRESVISERFDLMDMD